MNVGYNFSFRLYVWEPDRAIRMEEADIAAAEIRLATASVAEAKWSAAEGGRLDKAELVLTTWIAREEARIKSFETDCEESIAAMEVMVRESMVRRCRLTPC